MAIYLFVPHQEDRRDEAPHPGDALQPDDPGREQGRYPDPDETDSDVETGDARRSQGQKEKVPGDEHKQVLERRGKKCKVMFVLLVITRVYVFLR